MACEKIADVQLLPPGIGFLCRKCDKHIATHWVVAPDGECVPGGSICEKHGKELVAEFSEKLGETWTLHLIHHTDATDRCSRPRT